MRRQLQLGVPWWKMQCSSVSMCAGVALQSWLIIRGGGGGEIVRPGTVLCVPLKMVHPRPINAGAAAPCCYCCYGVVGVSKQ